MGVCVGRYGVNRSENKPDEDNERRSKLSGGMFSYVSLEDWVPQTHLLRKLRLVVDALFATMSADFDAVHAQRGRPSTASVHSSSARSVVLSGERERAMMIIDQFAPLQLTLLKCALACFPKTLMWLLAYYAGSHAEGAKQS